LKSLYKSKPEDKEKLLTNRNKNYLWFNNFEIPEDTKEQLQVISKSVVFKGICKECRK
jgi:hypothetical protein